MEMRDLLEKMMKFAGEKVGQKPGDQWRGSDKAPPGKKLVGDSILKDLSKGKTPKTKAEELAEEYQAFLEAEFKDTVDKRPGRKGARPSRGHAPQPRYKTVKTENWPKMVEFTPEIVNLLKSKGYRGPYELNTVKKIYKELRGLVSGISGNDHIMIKGDSFVIPSDSKFLVGAEGQMAPATTNQLLKYLGESAMSEKDIELQDYRSMSHKEFQTAYGMTKTEWMNKNKSLVIQNPDIKKALGINESHYKWVISFKDGKQAIYHQKSPHYSDATAASDIEYTLKSNPGAEIELATKDDQAFDWQALLNEADDNSPVEARWMVTVSDDEGQHLKTFRDEFPNLAAAKKAYDKHKPYASDFKYKSVKKNTNEAIDSDIVQPMGQDTFNRAGFNPIGDERDYLDTLSKLTNLSLKPGLDQAMKDHITQRIRDLNAEARKKGYTQVETRGHKVIATKLKDIERSKKFASGELKIPTPQERQAQLKKLEKDKPVKEFVASQPTSGVTPYGQPTTNPTDPKQAQAVAQATQTIKAATGTTAPNTNIAKALDAASQGKPVGQADMKILEPMMKDVATIAQDPKLAGQFKTLAQQVNQAQLKQQQAVKK